VKRKIEKGRPIERPLAMSQLYMFGTPTSCRRLRCPKGSRVITPSRKKWGNAGQDVRDRETIEERGNQKSPRCVEWEDSYKRLGRQTLNISNCRQVQRLRHCSLAAHVLFMCAMGEKTVWEEREAGPSRSVFAQVRRGSLPR
jgi:hypothetical protein